MESGSSYRRGALRCPECTGALQERATSAATVDVCSDCGGVFIEWFDGAPERVAPGIPAGPPAAPRGRGDGDCPLCRVPLVREHYPDQHGVEVARCGACAGTFVARGALAAVAALDVDDAANVEDGMIERALATLRRWFGWDEPGA